MFLVFPRLRIRVSVFAVPALLLILRLEGFLPFLIMLLSATAHESGHLITMRLCGYKPRRIDILPMGALIVCPEGIPYRHELYIALAGPLTSLLAATLSLLCFICSGSAEALFSFAANSVFGMFNLLPERKLDGGKALYCFLINKKSAEAAEKICSAASSASRMAFVAAALLFAVATNANLGVLLLTLVLVVQFLSK